MDLTQWRSHWSHGFQDCITDSRASRPFHTVITLARHSGPFHDYSTVSTALTQDWSTAVRISRSDAVSGLTTFKIASPNGSNNFSFVVAGVVRWISQARSRYHDNENSKALEQQSPWTGHWWKCRWDLAFSLRTDRTLQNALTLAIALKRKVPSALISSLNK